MHKLQRGLSEGQTYSWKQQMFYLGNNTDKREKETSGLSAHTKAASLSQLLVLLRAVPLVGNVCESCLLTAAAL